jgi:predicted nucleic acid-binding protein
VTPEIFANHERIGIDSNVLIYLLEGSGRLADAAGELVDGIAADLAEGVLSTLALAEICAGPAGAGEPALMERYADELRSLENVRLLPLSAEIAVDAAALRGSSGMSLADAIHVVSAVNSGATAFVTNDRRIKSTPQLAVVYLSQLSL